MSLLQALLRPFRPPVETYVAPELVVIHMPELTEAEAAPLEEALLPVLATVSGSGSTGIDQEGAEASLYLATDDAVELTRAILPTLLQHPLCRGASITVITRMVEMPSQSDSRRLALEAPGAIHAYLKQVESGRQHFLKHVQSRGAKHA